jgi:DNA processing protein
VKAIDLRSGLREALRARGRPEPGEELLARQEKRLKAVRGRLLGRQDEEYPAALREIPDAPAVLFARGARLSGRPAVAVVGARRASRAGLEAARVIAGDLARAGVAVVSGFARGVDAAAHRAAVDAGGETVAVFGCGIDVCYPSEQERLLADLLKKGTVLSEFAMEERPMPYYFPIRNRIIAGLVRIVCVVEAAMKSGSLITARCAADYGRDVAAVPGSVVSKVAEGSNALLKDGAILVRDAADLIAELPEEDRARLTVPASVTKGRLAAAPPLDPDATLVFGALHPDEPKDPDALIAVTGLTAARLSSALVVLELEGLVTALPGALFLRAREKT